MMKILFVDNCSRESSSNMVLIINDIVFVLSVHVGRNFINRGLMNVKMEDIESFLNQVFCSSGFSYNVATLDGQKVMNFEVSSRGMVAMEIKGYNYHFNM